MPRPTILPQWATTAVQNDQSGQYNTAQPPPEVMQIGWTLGVKPNRQYWNWLHRQTYYWLQWFDEMFGGSAESETLIPTWDGITNQPSVNFFYYSLVGDKCFFNGNIQWSGNLDTSNPFRMTNLPFPAKNVSGYLQCIQLERGTAATMANGKTLYANCNANTTNLLIRETDLATGTTIDTIDQGSSGTLRYSGFYIIEPS